LHDNDTLRLSFSAIGVITTVAGNGVVGTSGDGGPATSARLSHPQGVAVDALGNIYIADAYSNRIRMITKRTGVITTVAGYGIGGTNSGDGGQATLAELSSPQDVALDASGNIYIADTSNDRIRMVDTSTGVITTVAGGGKYEIGNVRDGGQAILADLSLPIGVIIDASGNIYIADAAHYRIRMVTKSTGVITTVAGTGTTGYSGDGGPATSAKLSFPCGIAVDASGNIYISDRENGRVRMVTRSTGVITTVAGNGLGGKNIGDGRNATSAVVIAPYGIALDAVENLYITQEGSNDNRIRKVTKSTGVITTVAGTGTAGYFGDGGQATSAELNSPQGVAVDASGNIYIADTKNKRIRMFAANEMPTSAPSTAPISTPSPSAASTSTPSPSAASTSTPSPSAAPTSTPSPSTAPISTPSLSTAPITSPSPSAASTSTPSLSAAPTSTPSPSAAPTLTPTFATIPATSFIAAIPTSSSTTLSTNIISGVIGGVGGLLLMLLILAVFCCCRRR
jgi:trimeric autotransporter adhesin